MLDWYQLMISVGEATAAYPDAVPFPHIVISRAVDSSALARIVDEWPGNDAPWRVSQRGKRSLNLVSGGIPATALALLQELNGDTFINNYLRPVTGIADLRSDPTIGGGGLHETLSGGFLPLHVDFNRQEIESELYYRRLNVLLFLNKDWNPDWYGSLELAAHPKSKENRVSIAPSFNRMVIAESSDRSWHGHPRVLRCPLNVSRKSIAVYYYSRTPHESYREYHSTDYRVNRKQLHRDKAEYEKEFGS